MTVLASEVQSTIGARVAAARRNRGMTQRDLAQALGVSSWTVDRIERGAVDVGRYLPSIADVTQTSRDWFAASTVAAAETPRGWRNAAAPRRRWKEPGPRLDRSPRHDPVLHRGRPSGAACRELHRHPDLPGARARRDVHALRVDRARRTCASVSRQPHSSCLRSRLRRSIPTDVACARARVPLRVPGAARGVRGRLSDLAARQRRLVVSRTRLARTAPARGRRADRSADGSPRPATRTSSAEPSERTPTSSSSSCSSLRRCWPGSSRSSPGRTVARFAPFLILAIFGVILLAQYRALLATTVVTMLVVGHPPRHSRTRHSRRGIRGRGFRARLLVRRLQLPAPQARDDRDDPHGKPDDRTPGAASRGTRPVAGLYRDIPQAIAIGSGPGRSRVAPGRRSPKPTARRLRTSRAATRRN